LYYTNGRAVKRKIRSQALLERAFGVRRPPARRFARDISAALWILITPDNKAIRLIPNFILTLNDKTVAQSDRPLVIYTLRNDNPKRRRYFI